MGAAQVQPRRSGAAAGPVSSSRASGGPPAPQAEPHRLREGPERGAPPARLGRSGRPQPGRPPLTRTSVVSPAGNDTSPESFLLHNALARKPKRIRTAFSPSQLLRLEHAFEKNHYVVGAERKQLAHSLSLTETQVSRPRHDDPIPDLRPHAAGAQVRSWERAFGKEPGSWFQAGAQDVYVSRCLASLGSSRAL